jgi:hypothetical protein
VQLFANVVDIMTQMVMQDDNFCCDGVRYCIGSVDEYVATQKENYKMGQTFHGAHVKLQKGIM